MYKRLVNLNNYKSLTHFRRTFLSNAYKCDENWSARLSTPILKNINLDTMYIELEQKFGQHGKASAIDIDIFSNSATDEHHNDEVTDLIHKFRLTSEATNVLESTGHAVIRNFLHHNQIEQLITVLDNRISYGIFLDYFTGNLLLDKLIQENNFKSAVKVSSFFMLQEEFENPITVALSLLSCFNCLANPENLAKEPIVEETNKKVEEIKVRVHYIRNDYFDDHFDITDLKCLLGKTLIGLSAKLEGSIKDTAKLVGLILYEKYDKASEFIKEIKSSQRNVYLEPVEQLKSIIPEHEIISELETITTIPNINNKLSELISSSIKNQESVDIEQQKKIYTSWIDVRSQKLNEEFERLKRAQTLKDIEEITKNLEDEERKLWFFENEEKLDLEIENKRVYYPKRWFGKKKKPRAIDVGYIPPEITKQRN